MHISITSLILSGILGLAVSHKTKDFSKALPLLLIGSIVITLVCTYFKLP